MTFDVKRNLIFFVRLVSLLAIFIPSAMYLIELAFYLSFPRIS